MATATLIAHSGAKYVERQELLTLRTPDSTETHKIVPHSAIVGSLVQALAFRNITVLRDQFAVTPDGLRLFGVMDINVDYAGVRLSLGLRNSHDKSFSLGLTVGFRTLVCDNMAFSGDFTPVLAKHSKNFNLIHSLEIGVSDMQRNFEPGFFVEHFIKDMGIALAEAEKLNLCLPGLAQAKQLYEAVRAQGYGRKGTQALMLALETLNNVKR